MALLPVALLALATLWWPESGDQALFIQFGSRMRHGAVYYRDLWDIKQPGLFWFYQLGDLIRPGGIGARLLEGLLVVGAGALVSVIVADWRLRRSVRLAAPLMVLGPYLAYSYLGGTGQIEGLMNVLLLTVLASSLPAGGLASSLPAGGSASSAPARGRLRPGWSWFVAGLAIGAVPVLKTLYAPLPLVLIGPAVWSSLRIDRKATLSRCGLALAGALIPAVAAIAYFAGHHALELALRTTFELPSQVAAHPMSVTDLLSPVRAGLRMFLLIGPLAVIGLLTARRRGVLPLFGGLAATALTALLLCVPQVTTPYRWLMFAAPLGLLAVGGLEVVLAGLQPENAGQTAEDEDGAGDEDEDGTGAGVGAGFGVRRGLAGLVLLVGLVPTVMMPLKLLATPPADRWGLSETARIARGEHLPPEDTRPTVAVARVAGQVPPGSQIYVLGDPRIYTLTGTEQGAEISGWTSALPPVTWTELARELTRARPRFIYLDGRDYSRDRAGPGKAVFDLVDRRYRLIARGPEGAWYRTEDVGRPLPEPGGNQMFRHPSR